MAIETDAILTEASTLLMDEARTRWSETELLGHLNSGQLELVSLKPEANTVVAAVQLAAGTRQALPSGGIQFLRLNRNMGTDGATPGKGIRIADMDAMNADNPDWHNDTADSVTVHYLFAEDDPKAFYVWPPQPAASQGHVEEVYSKAPVDAVIGGGNNISLADEYRQALLYWILHKAYAKNNAVMANQQRSTANLQSFFMELGLKDRAEAVHDPSGKAQRKQAVMS